MKIPAAWLREFVDVPEEDAELLRFCDLLTMAGLEVEEILESPAGPTLYTKITPNRGDWASVYGTAREAAAAGSLSLQPLPTAASALSYDTTGASVTIEAPDACARYAAKIIRSVEIRPSPQWMQDRLTAAGMRPVNNVVDVTNYVMLELGQPLHAFDLDTLPEGRIVVRRARENETITTLDGIERKLSPDVLCICDQNHPIAIAGIMGGGPTEVTAGTKNILIESAHFDPLQIRRTAKRLPLATEASYRFERYVDPALVPVAAQRAADLLHAVASGTAEPGLIDVYANRTAPRRVMARVDRIRKLLGADVDRDAMVAGLERLGLSVERSSGALDCLIPTWRPDLTIEDDIAEEVGRIALGYENLPETIPPQVAGGGDSPRGRFTDFVREMLVRSGLQDVLSHSLVAPSDLASADETAHAVRVRSALSVELSGLRASLLPNLIAVTARAHAAGMRDIGVFEIGPVYRTAEAGGYAEPQRVSGVIAGSAMPTAWSIKPDALPADLYYAKGIVEDLLRALGIGDLVWTTGTHPITHPGRTALVAAGDVPLGMAAELSETSVAAHDLPRRTYVFDLDADALSRLAAQAAFTYSPLPRFPAIVRDIAPVFERTVPFAAIERAVINAAGPLIESLRLTDVYAGPNLPASAHALTLRLTFRSPSETLKDAEVEAALNRVRAALTNMGADLRSGA